MELQSWVPRGFSWPRASHFPGFSRVTCFFCKRLSLLASPDVRSRGGACPCGGAAAAGPAGRCRGGYKRAGPGGGPASPPGEADRRRSGFSEVDPHHPCPFASAGSPGACGVSTKLPCAVPVVKLPWKEGYSPDELLCEVLCPSLPQKWAVRGQSVCSGWKEHSEMPTCCQSSEQLIKKKYSKKRTFSVDWESNEICPKRQVTARVSDETSLIHKTLSKLLRKICYWGKGWAFWDWPLRCRTLTRLFA